MVGKQKREEPAAMRDGFGIEEATGGDAQLTFGYGPEPVIVLVPFGGLGGIISRMAIFFLEHRE